MFRKDRLPGELLVAWISYLLLGTHIRDYNYLIANRAVEQTEDLV